MRHKSARFASFFEPKPGDPRDTVVEKLQQMVDMLQTWNKAGGYEHNAADCKPGNSTGGWMDAKTGICDTCGYKAGDNVQACIVYYESMLEYLRGKPQSWCWPDYSPPKGEEKVH